MTRSDQQAQISRPVPNEYKKMNLHLSIPSPPFAYKYPDSQSDGPTSCQVKTLCSPHRHMQVPLMRFLASTDSDPGISDAPKIAGHRLSTEMRIFNL